MVSNSKDNHPSKATPIMNRVPNTHPKAVMQAAPHLSPMGREMSNSQWHIQVPSEKVHQWILLTYTYIFRFDHHTLLKLILL